MVIDRRIKSALHALAAAMTLYYAFFMPQVNSGVQVLSVFFGVLFIAFSFSHFSLGKRFNLHPLWLLVIESIWFTVMAWALYQLTLHRAAFIYEGVGVLFFSLAAFAFIMRRKKEIVFTEED